VLLFGLDESKDFSIVGISDAQRLQEEITHPRRGSKIDQLSAKIVASGKQVYTLDLPENTGLMDQGVTGYAVPDLVDCILGQPVRIES
jgi:hypothetical protein